MFNNILHDTIKKILTIDSMALYNISGNHRMIDAIDNLIGTLLVIIPQCNDGKAAKTDIFFQQFVLRAGILFLEVQIFFKRQGIDRNGHKTPG